MKRYIPLLGLLLLAIGGISYAIVGAMQTYMANKHALRNLPHKNFIRRSMGMRSFPPTFSIFQPYFTISFFICP